MKVIFVILSIAVMCQVSFAGIIGRFRRDALAEGFDSTANLVKHLAQATGPLVTSVLKEIPKTHAYAKHRQELENFLVSYNEYQTKPGVCFRKSVELFEKFGNLMDSFEAKNASPEAKKIDDLFNSFESEELEKDMQDFVKKMEALGSADSNEIDDDEGQKIADKMMEDC